MPKIVNHEKMREDVALKAAAFFLEHGYRKTGMRQLCAYLGMSKSAVYHYYDSKKDIFRASIEAVVHADIRTLADRPVAAQASLAEKCDNFDLLLQILSGRFDSELKLTLDYIDFIGKDAVQDDPNIQLANQKYLELLAQFVDEAQAEHLLTVMIGLLTNQMLGIALPDRPKIHALLYTMLGAAPDQPG